MSRQLYLNFIKDNRWKYIVNGLGTTLQITFFAVILGIALGFLIAVIRSTYDKTGKGKILNFLAKVCYSLGCKIEDLLEYCPPQKTD